MLEQVLFLIDDGKRIINNKKGKKQIYKNMLKRRRTD